MNILCSFGIHKWRYEDNYKDTRVCMRCGRKEGWYFWWNSGDGYWVELVYLFSPPEMK